MQIVFWTSIDLANSAIIKRLQSETDVCLIVSESLATVLAAFPVSDGLLLYVYNYLSMNGLPLGATSLSMHGVDVVKSIATAIADDPIQVPFSHVCVCNRRPSCISGSRITLTARKARAAASRRPSDMSKHSASVPNAASVAARPKRYVRYWECTPPARGNEPSFPPRQSDGLTAASPAISTRLTSLVKCPA